MKENIISLFQKNNGYIETNQLNDEGISNYYIKKLVDEEIIRRIKRGSYVLNQGYIENDILISKMFPDAVIYLESALNYYGYSDRIPKYINVAVDRNSSKERFDIKYPRIQAHFLEKYVYKIGITSYFKDDVKIKIYDRERTICDLYRNRNKISRDIYNDSLKRYVRDDSKDIFNLYKYAEELKIKQDMFDLIGVLL